jgi:hypothetical protein
MVLCMAEVVNCGMGMELYSQTWRIDAVRLRDNEMKSSLICYQ